MTNDPHKLFFSTTCRMFGEPFVKDRVCNRGPNGKTSWFYRRGLSLKEDGVLFTLGSGKHVACMENLSGGHTYYLDSETEMSQALLFVCTPMILDWAEQYMGALLVREGLRVRIPSRPRHNNDGSIFFEGDYPLLSNWVRQYRVSVNIQDIKLNLVWERGGLAPINSQEICPDFKTISTVDSYEVPQEDMLNNIALFMNEVVFWMHQP